MNELKNKSIFLFIKPLWINISFKRRRQLIISLILIIFNGLLDLISITSILPILYLLTSNPEVVMEKSYIKIFAEFFNINSSNQILILSVFLLAFLAFISGLLKLFNLYFNTRLSGSISSDLSLVAFTKVINQSYSYHINLNSSEVITSITTYVNALNGGLINLMQLITGSVLSAFIIFGVILINWKLSLIGLLVYTVLYVLIGISGKKRITRNSKFIADANIKIVKGIQETLGSIRDIILNNLASHYISTHKKTEYSMRKLMSQNIFLTFFPRYLLEALSLILISVIILLRLSIFSDAKTIIPTLGAFAVGMQKLLPSFQLLYTSWASLNSQKFLIFKLLKFIELQNKTELIVGNDLSMPINKSFKFNFLELKNVSFKYQNKKEFILKGLDLNIRSGEKIGIIGKTGDGKSTLLDIIMGLLEPTQGEILINGKNLNKNNMLQNMWRNEISHVPQNIYLLDTNITENIALGNSKNLINFKYVEVAAKLAQVTEFVSQFPMKFDTVVGEGGIKLSGGQKQRIGIARAFYTIPRILVLDESTSALDEETERLIMDSIINMNKNMTIIIVTHRLKSLKYCERIIKLKKGKIVFDGLPADIIKS